MGERHAFPPGDDGHAHLLVAPPQCLTREAPEPVGECRSRSGIRLEELQRGDLDDDQVVAAGAQVEQRSGGTVVEEWRDREHQRLRRERPRRQHVDAAHGIAEDDVASQQRVDDGVELTRPRLRQQPAEKAAEADEPDAVLPLQVPVRERRRRAHRAVVRAPAVRAHLGEGVEEEDDVGVPLLVLLVHPERAAKRGRTPVDASHTVARLPLAEIGELDPLTAGSRDLVSGEHLCLQRRHEGVERLLARVDPQRLRLAWAR